MLQILREAPEDAEALFYRGECHLVEGHLTEAEADYRAAIAVESDDAIYYHRLGEALLEQERPEEALAEFTKAIELEDASEYLRGRARALMALEKPDEALADINKSIDLEPEAESLQVRAELLAALGKRDEAIENYSTAISLDPFDPKSWHARAILRAEADMLEPALEDMQMAVERAPNEAAVHADHGRLLTRLGKAEEGRVALEKALELEPDDVTAIASLAVRRLTVPP